MSQALSGVFFIYFHLILPSIPYTSFVNDGRGVESSIVTPFSVNPWGMEGIRTPKPF